MLSNQSATGVTLQWNATEMDPVTSARVAGTEGIAHVHRQIAPEVGTLVLTAAWTGESDAVLGAVSVSGADQSECVRAIATAEGASDTASVTIASAPGHLTIDVSAATHAFATPTREPQWLAGTDGAPRLIQQATHAVTAMTDSCTFPAAPTPGHNLIFVGATSGSAVLSVDGAGVVWQRASGSAANANIEIWYGEATTGIGTAVTYTGLIQSTMGCWIGELSGLAPSASLDGASAFFGDTGPAAPGPFVTSHAHDLLVVGYSNFGQTTWSAPTEGPWTSVGEFTDAGRSQIGFTQVVERAGTWNPSIDATSSDPRWEAAAAGFKIATTGVAGALSTAPGGASNEHAWALDAVAGWVSVGLDVFP